MRQTIKKLSATVLLCMAAMLARAEAIPGVAVLDKDGSTYELALESLDRLNFGQHTLTVVTTAGEEKNFEYADIDKINFGVEVSAINAINAAGNIAVWPTLVSAGLNISGAQAGTAVRVYSASGALLLTATCGEGTLSLDMSKVPAGLCVVAVGDRSVKVIKK